MISGRYDGTGRLRLSSHGDHLWVIDGFCHNGRSSLESEGVTKILKGYSAKGALSFVRGENGKPAIEGSDLHFSVSHSHNVLVMIISKSGPVGIDVERIKDRRHAHRIAARYFGSAEHGLANFYRGWTAREAFIKAQGGRLFKGLSRITVCEADVGLDGELSHRIEFFSPADGYIAAICRPR